MVKMNIGKSINMRDLRRELEQRVECRGVELEFEQQSDEFQHECWLLLRLQCLKLRIFEIVELQGFGFPALCEITKIGIFGRATLWFRRPFLFQNQDLV